MQDASQCDLHNFCFNNSFIEHSCLSWFYCLFRSLLNHSHSKEIDFWSFEKSRSIWAKHRLLGEAQASRRSTGFWAKHRLLGKVQASGRSTGFWAKHRLLGEAQASGRSTGLFIFKNRPYRIIWAIINVSWETKFRHSTRRCLLGLPFSHRARGSMQHAIQ